MTVDVTYVELKNFPKYVCQIDIFGVPCLLTASYNSRKGQRLISLTSYDGDIVYLKPTFITNFDRVFLNFNMLLNELDVYVTLEALTVNGVKQTSTDYLNWSSSYRLAFVSLPPTERLEGFRNLSDEEVFEEFEWVVTSSEYLTEGSYQTVRYTGTRVIENKDYNSYADIDLVEYIVRSFHDEDLQQYGAFTSAVEQLIGAVDWVLDSANNQIKYTSPADPENPPCETQYYNNALGQNRYCSVIQLGQAYCSSMITNGTYSTCTVTSATETAARFDYSFTSSPNTTRNSSVSATKVIVTNPGPEEEETLPLDVLAAQVISNAESGEDEVLKLLSEDYINIVAESIFNNDASKQFVKLEDLKPQFELNKVLVQ